MTMTVRSFVIFALLMLAGPALAQNAIEAPSNPDVFADIAQGEIGQDGENQVLAEGPVQQLADWSEELDTLREELSRDSLTLDALATLRDEVTSVRNDIQVLVDEVAPRLAEQRALLEGLAPADGELAETPEIQAQQERIAELERELQPAELLLGRANTLRDEVISRRAVEFTGRLFERSSSILTPQLWADGLGDMPRLTQRLVELTENSWNSVRARATPASFAGLGVLVLILLILAIPLRRFALRKAARAETVDPSSFEKTLGALRIVLVSTLIPAIGFLMLLFGLESVGGLSLRAKAVLNAVAANTILFLLISGIVRAFLAPGLPAWRLVPVGDGYARTAEGFFRLAAFAYLVGELLRAIAAVFVSPLVVVQLLEALPSLVAALSILIALRALLRGLAPSDADETPPISHMLWRWTLPITGLAALAVIVAQLFGLLALGAFIVDRLVWTSVVLAGLHLAAALVEGLTSATLQEETPASVWLHDNIGLSANGLGQFGVLLSGIVKLVLIVAAASLIIAPFGVETGQLTDIFRRVFTGIEIGGFSFSLTSVLIALALVFIGVVVTRGIQGWLENRYLPRTSLDTGLKASIRTGIGYVGIIVAASIGLSSLGLDLENIALVAGALSVGIGFGLQSIVSNFVSGLILLAERPFKQGDWIVVGEEQGIVKRINVRATELQTFDRATVLIPNQDFIAGTVKNRVHRDTLGRIDVPVGVGYDSDPQKVKEILLEVANAHPMTLSYPEPAAFFVEFGASSLDFMLFAYLADVGNGYGVRSDLRFEIFRRFQEEGIEIPFAQSDVTIRNLDTILDALAKAGATLPEGLGAGGLSGDEAIKQTGVSTVPAPEPQVSTAAELRSSRMIDPDGDGALSDDTGPDDGPVDRG
jgi:small-conductance mechanosensitive channel